MPRRPRSFRVEVRVRKSELSEWMRAAFHADVSVSEWIRRQCNFAVPPKKIYAKDTGGN